MPTSPFLLNSIPHDLTNLKPSLPAAGVAPFLNAASASSHALPAPNPNPTQAGHARRLKSKTEKMTPKERPRVERMTREEMAWSHCLKGCCQRGPLNAFLLRCSMRMLADAYVRVKGGMQNTPKY